MTGIQVQVHAPGEAHQWNRWIDNTFGGRMQRVSFKVCLCGKRVLIARRRNVR